MQCEIRRAPGRRGCGQEARNFVKRVQGNNKTKWEPAALISTAERRRTRGRKGWMDERTGERGYFSFPKENTRGISLPESRIYVSQFFCLRRENRRGSGVMWRVPWHASVRKRRDRSLRGERSPAQERNFRKEPWKRSDRLRPDRCPTTRRFSWSYDLWEIYFQSRAIYFQSSRNSPLSRFSHGDHKSFGLLSRVYIRSRQRSYHIVNLADTLLLSAVSLSLSFVDIFELADARNSQAIIFWLAHARKRRRIITRTTESVAV